MEEHIKRNHKFEMTNRENLKLTGIKDVISFDANEILMDTEQGLMMIRGEELHIRRITVEKGEAEVDGRVNSINYSEKNQSKNEESILARLFR